MDFVPDIVPDNVQYMIYQREKCPDTGKLHWQGYIELTKPMRLAAVKQILQDPSVHIEPRKGTQEEAIAYCKKEASRDSPPVEIGTPTKQGRRTDLAEAAKLRKSQIIQDYPEIYIKYAKGINELEMIRQKTEQKLRLDIKVIALIGKAGSGKTRFVYDNHPLTDIYKLNTNSNGTLWFDGYTDESVLLIDDFYGWIKYTDLLTILDIYPYRCQVKGSYCYAAWKTIYITSNYGVDRWYSSIFDIEALKRRITEIKIFT